jgi:3-dehydroquinate dehydratase I
VTGPEGGPLITIGNLELGKKPRIAAVVDSIIPVQRLLDLKQLGVDLLEVRVDLIDQQLDSIEKYLYDLKLAVTLPMIGTVRENERTRDGRSEYFKRIMPYVDAVDIELDAPIAREIRELARAKGDVVIVSDHDFEKTPDITTLRNTAARAMAQGADIVKVVTMARNADDAWRLVTFAGTCEVPVVAFAMGEAGVFSRIRACEFGSLFTYGYITQAVAPGQLSAEDLVRKIKIKV